MNVEYMCKARRKDNGQWVAGYYVCLNENCHRIYIGYAEKDHSDYYPEYYEVIPETVVRCTGLQDKNGKLISEGDILESRASENKEDWKRWVVQFIDGSFCFEREIPRKRKHKYEQNLLCVDEIELYGLIEIGNIHDDKELLEVER